MQNTDDLPTDSTPEPGAEVVAVRPWYLPQRIGGTFYLVVLTVAVVSIVVSLLVDWRLGIRLLAGALATGALLRLVLRTSDAGMLQARSKPVDVLTYASVSALMFFLASSIPDQPL